MCRVRAGPIRSTNCGSEKLRSREPKEKVRVDGEKPDMEHLHERGGSLLDVYGKTSPPHLQGSVMAVALPIQELARFP